MDNWTQIKNNNGILAQCYTILNIVIEETDCQATFHGSIFWFISSYASEFREILSLNYHKESFPLGLLKCFFTIKISKDGISGFLQ